MKNRTLRTILCLMLLLPTWIRSQPFCRLKLPRQELLSSDRVLQVMQDAEGYLWYATEGGGLCRDDGREMLVLRSDAGHPNLLGSNEVARLAEMGRKIIVGTFHGAYVLDKGDYSIRQLTEVDAKRVDDIMVDSRGHLWLTANKKVYEFSAQCTLLHTYPTGDKYLSRLHEDRNGTLWATQWSGALLRLQNGRFVDAPWSYSSAPTAIVDAAEKGKLWIGTVGGGIVLYDTQSGAIRPQPSTGDAVCIDMQQTGNHLWLSTTAGLHLFKLGAQLETCPADSLLPDNGSATGSLTLDLNGRLLVAAAKPYAISTKPQQSWLDGQRLSRRSADSLQTARGLTAHPTAYTTNQTGRLWYSTGQDIRRLSGHADEVVLSDVRDVSALTFTPDGSLWMATIFGKILCYKDGTIATDDYATNEYGDAVAALGTDEAGRLLIAFDRYTRRYDTHRKTLSQQNVEDAGTYRLELQESAPQRRWSQPKDEERVGRTPLWLWATLLVLTLVLTALVAYILRLRRQRKRFIEALKMPLVQSEVERSAEDVSEPTDQDAKPEASTPDTAPGDDGDTAANTSPLQDEWLQKAIMMVEKNLSDEHYTVELLSADMCMSRMTFYRKIQTATGYKPTEFIRSIRLSRAAEMLKSGRMNVTEISYATGFSSVSYFSRCFRTMYGVPPTQFATDLGRTTTADDRSSKESPSLESVVR